ncbi:MAG: rhomboid family intramembrane serine protease [Verrucomicrobia bacterium]|nr:rhomboid family intramembrane serine protease [Verrucomicrobiota bacterium]MDA1065511.1 rhomboid family intramembrane serine protease [Verrucomicrobiota bacterium]
MKKFPPVVLVLIAINALVFAPSLLAPEIGRSIQNHFALYFPKNDEFQLIQFISYMFLHGSPAHIFFNMFALASFGVPLTMIWGWRRFLSFYFATGIGAAIIYTAVNYYQFSNAYGILIGAGFTEDSIKVLLESFKADPSLTSKVPEKVIKSLISIYHAPAVGASGAIYGILVAFGVLFPNAKLSLMFIPAPVAAKFFIPALVLLDMFSGITGFSLFGGGIAHWAHVGGAVIGFLIMLYWKAKLSRR